MATAAPIGGEGYRKLPIDNCPDKDISPTPYDGLCAGMSPFIGGILADSINTATATGSNNMTGEVSFSTGDINNDATTGTHELIEDPSSMNAAARCTDSEEQSAYEF